MAFTCRYFVLFEYGGVYMDLDVECLKTLEPVIQQNSCVLSQVSESQDQRLTYNERAKIYSKFD